MHERDLDLRWYVIVGKDGTERGVPFRVSTEGAARIGKVAKAFGQKLREVPAPRFEQSHRQR